MLEELQLRNLSSATRDAYREFTAGSGIADQRQSVRNSKTPG